jgi:hypothetical protein
VQVGRENAKDLHTFPFSTGRNPYRVDGTRAPHPVLAAKSAAHPGLWNATPSALEFSFEAAVQELLLTIRGKYGARMPAGPTVSCSESSAGGVPKSE